MASGVFNKGLFELASALTDLDSADLRVLLVQSTYTFSPTNNYIADLSAHEISVSGYSRQALSGETVVEDDTNHRAYLDASDVTFTGLAAGQTIGGAVIYRHTGSDATAPLLCYVAIAATATGGDFTIQWAATSAGAILYLASA